MDDRRWRHRRSSIVYRRNRGRTFADGYWSGVTGGAADRPATRQNVLVVVEDQQEGQRGEVLQYRGGQRLSGYLGDVQRLGEERHHEVGAGRVGQRYEHRAVGEPVRDGRADRERQPRLADPGRADQGDQPAFGEQLRDLHGLVLPPDQLGDGYRQLVCVPLRLGQQGRGDGQGAVLRAYQMPA